MPENLIDSAQKLPVIPFSAAEEFSAKKDTLISEVNQTLAENPRVKELIGNNPMSLLFENHSNSALFMSNVFKLNDFAFFAKVVLWVYRTYYNQGFSYDYFPVAMQAWINAIENNICHDNAVYLTPAYRWIIDNHEKIIESSGQAEDTAFAIEPGWQNTKKSYLATLLEGNHRQALKIADEAVHSANELADFYLQVIQPAMYDIGLLWEKGEISVAQEHLASAIVTRVMASLYPRFILIEKSRGKAVVTAAPNEFHEIGPRMVADLLELDGWDIDYIGANVPAKDLLDLLGKNNPFFLAISVSMPFNLDNAREIIHTIKDNPQIRETKIMLGGYCIAKNPELKEKIGADGYGVSAKEAVNLASEWWLNA